MLKTLNHWLLTSFCALFISQYAWAAPTLTVLYKRESAQSATRTDTAVQAALLAFERELIDGGVEIIQPDAKTYAVLDQAAEVIVTFSADAGLSLLIDIVKTTRDNPSTDNAFAEVRMRARLFHGRQVLAAIAGNGQVGFRRGSEDKAFEVAAERAVKQLVGKVLEKLEHAPNTPASAAIDNSPLSAETIQTTKLPKPTNKWALIVGVSDFSNVRKQNPGVGIDDLAGVKGDVALVKKTALELRIPESQIIVLLNRDATTNAVRSALKDLSTKTGSDDLVFFYIASHGLPKQEGVSGFGFPVTYDTKLREKSTIIDFEEIQSHLKSMPARKIIWVADTCHSGGATLGLPVLEISSRSVRLGKPSTGLSTRAATQGFTEKDMVVLASAREDQVALEDGENGLFTLKLSQALQKTRGTDTIYKIYKDHLESQVPARSRELDPGYSQQPAFAGSGKGAGITLN